jgi:hypothetical protein
MAETLDQKRPAWLESLNAAGRPEWVSLDEASLLDEARARTGLRDFGDDAFRQPLEVLLASIDKENSLHFVGRVIARDDIVTLLENRLRMTEDRKRNPAIADVAIDAPIFVTGLPRTGTSILHELLACDPDHRVPLAWEVRSPSPPPDARTFETDPRIDACERALRLWGEIVPEYLAIHELGARLPVECIVLTAHEFRSDQLTATNHALAYGAWLAGADLRPAYEGHRRMLQHLGWRNGRKRWVLKAPSHLPALATLLAVYPDARIIQTHRDPLRVMGSVLSTLHATARVRAERIDGDSLVAWFSGEVCAALLDNAARVRESDAARNAKFADVLYADLMTDPIATIRAIYSAFDLDLSDDAADRMREYLASKPKDKHGAHTYDAGGAAVDVTKERRRFAAYQRRYSVPSE